MTSVMSVSSQFSSNQVTLTTRTPRREPYCEGIAPRAGMSGQAISGHFQTGLASQAKHAVSSKKMRHRRDCEKGRVLPATALAAMYPAVGDVRRGGYHHDRQQGKGRPAPVKANKNRNAAKQFEDEDGPSHESR